MVYICINTSQKSWFNNTDQYKFGSSSYKKKSMASAVFVEWNEKTASSIVTVQTKAVNRGAASVNELWIPAYKAHNVLASQCYCNSSLLCILIKLSSQSPAIACCGSKDVRMLKEDPDRVILPLTTPTALQIKNTEVCRLNLGQSDSFNPLIVCKL